MLKLRSLPPLGAVLLAASLLAQQEIPPPPPTPPSAPGDVAATPKVNVPAAPKEAEPSSEAPAEAAATPKPRSSRPRAATTPMPIATPMPAATPKPGFWQRIFGARRKASPHKSTPAPSTQVAEKPTPKATGKKPQGTAEKVKTTPAPESTPKATPKPRATPDPDAPKATPKPRATPDPDAPKATPRPEATPKPTPEPKPTPVKKTSAAKPPTADAGGDTEAIEREKFAAAKTKALEDPAIGDLKSKVDNAENDTQAKTALRAYNKALFQKMRKLDPSIKERIDAMEEALMKRLGE